MSNTSYASAPISSTVAGEGTFGTADGADGHEGFLEGEGCCDGGDGWVFFSPGPDSARGLKVCSATIGSYGFGASLVFGSEFEGS